MSGAYPDSMTVDDIPDAPPRRRITWREFQSEHRTEADAAEREWMADVGAAELVIDELVDGDPAFMAVVVAKIKTAVARVRRLAVEGMGYELRR